MYLQHFGFTQFPFTLTPNTHFYWDSKGHRNAMLAIYSALEMGEGFLKVTGEVGSGKTLLCRRLSQHLPEKYLIVQLSNPLLNPLQLFQSLASELYVQVPAEANAHQLIQAITGKLTSLRRRERHVVLVVDEAHMMSVEALDTLRLLTNMETEDHKLLHILLFGQPELDITLQDVRMRQLAQRIVFSEVLQPFEARRDIVHAYIQHRCGVAGNDTDKLFSPTAARTIARHSNGNPRVINILGHKSLIAAYSRGQQQVTWRSARAAIRDSHSIIQSTQVQAQTPGSAGLHSQVHDMHGQESPA